MSYFLEMETTVSLCSEKHIQTDLQSVWEHPIIFGEMEHNMSHII